MALSVYGQVQANKRKTLYIMVFFSFFLAMVAYIFGKTSGYGISWTVLALVISSFANVGSYFWGDKIILTMSGAHPADRTKDFDLYTVTENMAIAAGIPMPKLYIIEDSAPNAFATGRDPQHATVCATRGLIDKLDRRELEGVIGHEISHITNYDTRVMAIVTVLVGTIAFLADWFSRSLWWGGGRRDRDSHGAGQILFIAGIVLAVLAPIIAALIQFALSRKREFLADASGALLTRNPKALATALAKISGDKEVLEAATNGTAHLFITNPFKGKEFGAWFSGLFDTHPPVQERIKILSSM